MFQKIQWMAIYTYERALVAAPMGISNLLLNYGGGRVV